MQRAPILTLAIALMVPLLPTPALAAGQGLMELLRVLRDNGTISREQYGMLITAAKADSEAQDQALEAARTSTVKVDTEGGLEIATYDGEFSFQLGGRLMLDGAFHNEDRNDLGDGTEVRRARLEAEGTMFGDWGYELGVDFADEAGEVDVKDAYISYQGLSPTTFKVGQFKEPFSLEELTSSKYITFMERALPNELAPGRNLGIGAHRVGEQWTLAAGLFGEDLGGDVDSEGNEGWALTGRATYAPWAEDRRVLHLGAAASHRRVNSEGVLDFAARPESHITDVKYLNTGDLADADTLNRYGLEAATVWGPWSLQGEYIAAELERDRGAPDLDLAGWYLFGSWFLTGESRPYKLKKGAFGRVKPRSPWGALELAARYSTLDLNDGLVSGGEEDNWTLGMNWYVNPHVRFMANYVHVDTDERADDAGEVAGNDDPDLVQVRMQLDF